MNSSGHNLSIGELLRGFVERVENINTQMEDLRADRNVIMAEAKAADLLPKGINYIVRKRKMKPSERAEAEALEDTYLHAMGMAADNPLFRAVGMMKVDIASRTSVIEAMKKLVPLNGSVEINAGGGPKVRLSRDSDGNVSVTELVDKPSQPELPGTRAKPAARAPVPNVDGDEAERMGAEAFKADLPVTSNPFPFGDARRPRYDLGWRRESGTDGMGPEE